ncbi:unnamed protein product [Lactuca virosa]|uniref:Uncharacterized protein n=1 Tax=Lactuca virosa TaxID=75947 RepID=A0AAU9N7N6_9ASTR|nr:unnamed protein product [Lactuca virosa]
MEVMKHMSHEEIVAKNKLESTEKDLIIKEISTNDCLQRKLYGITRENVQYPTYSDLYTNENLSLIQSMQSNIKGIKDANNFCILKIIERS